MGVRKGTGSQKTAAAMKLIYLLLGVLVLVVLSESRHHRHHRHHHHHRGCRRCNADKRGKKGPCPLSVICKGVETLQKALEAQTQAVTAQGKVVAGRLDASEGKMTDIETIGKKLTDLMGVSQNKITEQGAALGAQEAKLSEQLTQVTANLEAKIEGQDAKLKSIEDTGLKLDAEITDSDTKIGAIQTEGIKILDTLDGQQKKISGALSAKVAALAKELPVPDGKFSEIEAMSAKLGEKMNDQDTKIAAVAGIATALKEKVSASGVKLGDLSSSQEKINAKIEAQDADIGASATQEEAVQQATADQEAKMTEVVAQSSALAATVTGAQSKVAFLAKANLARKGRLAKQKEALIAVSEQTKAAIGKMKSMELKLGSVADDLAAPKDPPPAPPAASPSAAEAAAAAEAEQQTLEDNAKKIAEMNVAPPPFPKEFFMDDTGVKLAKNNMVGTLPELPQEFEISFEVKPTAYAKGWHNVLHFTSGKNGYKPDTRTPAVWFSPKTDGKTNRMRTTFPISGKLKNRYHKKRPLNKWIKVKMTQKKGMLQLYENGKRRWKKKNKKPQVFKNVKIYAGDPWYEPVEGFMRKLRINDKVG